MLRLHTKQLTASCMFPNKTQTPLRTKTPRCDLDCGGSHSLSVKCGKTTVWYLHTNSILTLFQTFLFSYNQNQRDKHSSLVPPVPAQTIMTT